MIKSALDAHKIHKLFTEQTKNLQIGFIFSNCDFK